MKVWVDDIRLPPDNTWLKRLTSQGAIDWLESCKTQGWSIDIMSLDHDLGGDDTTRPIVIWMCDNDFWPVQVVVHSANPPGVYWLEGMIDRYHPNNAHKHRLY